MPIMASNGEDRAARSGEEARRRRRSEFPQHDIPRDAAAIARYARRAIGLMGACLVMAAILMLGFTLHVTHARPTIQVIVLALLVTSAAIILYDQIRTPTGGKKVEDLLDLRLSLASGMNNLNSLLFMFAAVVAFSGFALDDPAVESVGCTIILACSMWSLLGRRIR